MKVTQISASYRRTINLGNFESVTIEASLSADLDDGDDKSLCMKELFAIAKQEARATLPDRALNALKASEKAKTKASEGES